jgi:hypothetical protein
VLLGQSTSSASIASAIGKGAIPATGIAVAIPEAPQVKLGHRPALAETLVLNEVVSRDTTSPLDVGEGVARSTFAGAFGALVRGGLVDGKGLDVTAPKLSQIVQGEGVVGQSPSERVKEYIYTVPRKVNGVGVFGAGVEVSVHRTNRLSKISTFGPTVISTVAKDGSEIPDGSGYNFVRAVPSGDLLARANAENAGATVQPLGLQYVLPEGASDAVVEPTEVYFVVPTMTVDGRTLHGRAHLVAYSVSNKAAASVVWPRPAVGAKGDPNK